MHKEAINRSIITFGLILLILLPLALAATLEGTIYNTSLEPEHDVLVEINTIPVQRFLARDGIYSFEVAPGRYNLTAQKGADTVVEEIDIAREGTFVYDLFLIPEFLDEDDLWADTQQELIEDDTGFVFRWQYLVAGIILIFALYRYIRIRRKYGPLWTFRKRVKEESRKTMEQHKEEIAREPGYLERALEIIKKNDGRMTQKELRKEMLPLSEAKVSLIITELEHKGKVEKIKRGRGNVIVLRDV